MNRHKVKTERHSVVWALRESRKELFEKSIGVIFTYVGVAQLEEHLTFNQDVRGSNPLAHILNRMFVPPSFKETVLCGFFYFAPTAPDCCGRFLRFCGSCTKFRVKLCAFCYLLLSREYGIL